MLVFELIMRKIALFSLMAMYVVSAIMISILTFHEFRSKEPDKDKFLMVVITLVSLVAIGFCVYIVPPILKELFK